MLMPMNTRVLPLGPFLAKAPRLGPFLRCFGSAFPASVPDLAEKAAGLGGGSALPPFLQSLRQEALCQARPKRCFIVATGFRLNQKSCKGAEFLQDTTRSWEPSFAT